MCANPAEPVRVVYFGTPDYAVPALESLIADPRVEIPLVVTQPDRPAGRGRKLASPPVKELAITCGIDIYQPQALRTEDDRLPIADIEPDLFVVAAFGKIFGPKLLAIPRLGAVNLHASLLPRFRGASPISAAILEGDAETGITLMQMDVGLDTGPILAQRSLAIPPDAATASLTPALAELGATLLIESLSGLISRSLEPVPQGDQNANLTRPLFKADGWIDWNESADQIERQIRAMWEWPRGWTTLRGETVQIHRAHIETGSASEVPGTVEVRHGEPSIATGAGRLIIDIAQTAGSKPLAGPAWLQQSGAVGEMLGTTGAPEKPALPMVRAVLE